jgi:hypothetical protein
MENKKELTLRDLMQMSHDMEEFQKDFDMITEFMGIEEVKTSLKKKD